MNARFISCLCLCLLGLGVLTASGCARYQRRDRNVIVMDFENNITDASKAVLSQSLADFMTASLANYERVRVVDRQGFQWLLDDAYDKPVRWQKVGRQAGADYLIIGSVSQLNGIYIVSSRIFSVQTGQIVPGSAVTRPCEREEDLYPVTQSICRVLGYHLKVLAERHDALHGLTADTTQTGGAPQAAALQ